MTSSMVVMVAVAVMIAVVTMVIVTVAMASSRPNWTSGSHPKHDKSDAGKFYFCHESLHFLDKDHS
jgi:flagellar basal body-associated protein FliL